MTEIRRRYIMIEIKNDAYISVILWLTVNIFDTAIHKGKLTRYGVRKFYEGINFTPWNT